MICPHCGKETEAGKACDRCGKDLESSKGMEIEYKEFKVSELLDIKMTRQGPGDRTMTGPAGGRKKTDKFTVDTGLRRKPGKAKAWVMTTAVMIILAIIAVFYLLRSFFRF
jgi:uncharacterized membrane protein YvbJ